MAAQKLLCTVCQLRVTVLSSTARCFASKCFVCARLLNQVFFRARGVGTCLTRRGALGEKHRHGLSLHAAHHGTPLRLGTPPRRVLLAVIGSKTCANWDYASPTGGAHVDGLPPDFKTLKTHLESREVFGKTLLRRIAATTWSTKYNLAGKEVAEVRLVDLLWRGWQNFHIRALSHGQYLSVVIARKVSETLHRLFSASYLSVSGRLTNLPQSFVVVLLLFYQKGPT